MTLIVVLAAFLLILGSTLVLREVIQADRAESSARHPRAVSPGPAFSDHEQRRAA